jgi:hypothetical protein
MAENMALDPGVSSYTFANATNADIQDSSDDAVGIDVLLVESATESSSSKGPMLGISSNYLV